MQLLITGIEWLYDTRRWKCTLQGYGDTIYQLELKPQQMIEWQIQSGRACIGSITYRKSSSTQTFTEIWKPCPDNASPMQGKRCLPCAQATELHPCIRCNGSICRADPQRQQTCSTQTSYVYLASFGPKLLKVGVAHHSRIPKRWIEQGANVATRLLETNGRKARRYETFIHDTFNVRSQVPTQYKFDTLWKFMTQQETTAISTLVDEIQRQAPNLPFYQDTIHDLTASYGLPLFAHRPLLIAVAPHQLVTGMILGVKGSILVLQVHGIPHTLNLRQLIGRSIMISEGGSTVVQRVLDEF
jgi:hypothetical protein